MVACARALRVRYGAVAHRTALKVIAGAIEVKNMKRLEETTFGVHPSFQSDM